MSVLTLRTRSWYAGPPDCPACPPGMSPGAPVEQVFCWMESLAPWSQSSGNLRAPCAGHAVVESQDCEITQAGT